MDNLLITERGGIYKREKGKYRPENKFLDIGKGEQLKLLRDESTSLEVIRLFIYILSRCSYYELRKIPPCKYYLTFRIEIPNLIRGGIDLQETLDIVSGCTKEFHIRYKPGTRERESNSVDYIDLCTCYDPAMVELGMPERTVTITMPIKSYKTHYDFETRPNNH